MNKTLIILLIFGLILGGCGSKTQPVAPVEPAKDAATTQPAATEITAPAVAAGNEPVKEFTMIAKNWEFGPDKITAKLGDRVKIKITSEDVKHGFGLPAYGINEDLEPGKTVEIEFIAAKSGKFPFRCTVPCGEGHRVMTGELIVEE